MKGGDVIPFPKDTDSGAVQVTQSIACFKFYFQFLK